MTRPSGFWNGASTIPAWRSTAPGLILGHGLFVLAVVQGYALPASVAVTLQLAAILLSLASVARLLDGRPGLCRMDLERELDERERQQVAQAHLLAYRILVSRTPQRRRLDGRAHRRLPDRPHPAHGSPGLDAAWGPGITPPFPHPACLVFPGPAGHPPHRAGHLWRRGARLAREPAVCPGGRAGRGWVGRAGYAADRAGAMPLMKPSRLGRPEGRNREMDERQWQQRSQAHLRALGVVWAASTC